MPRLPLAPRGRGALGWAVGAFVLIYAALMAASFVDPGFAGEPVSRNVELSGQAVGGYDDEELASLIAEREAELSDATVAIDAGHGPVTAPADELGLVVDEERTREALEDGDVPLLLRPFAWVGSFFTERDVDLRFGVDEAQLASRVTDLEVPGIREAREPGLEGDGSGVRVVAGEPGAGLDPEILARALEAAATAGSDRIEVRLELVEVLPRVTEDAAREVAAAAEAATATPLDVTVGEVQRPLDVATQRSWVVLTIDESGAADWAIDESMVAEDLAELYGDAGTAGTDVSFYVENDQVAVIPGESPTSCCAPDSADRILSALESGAPGVTLALAEGDAERGVEWAESLGIVEPVATFTTTHSCCQNRVTNIHLIAEATRGVVIEPGETFSLNGHVGPRTAEKGYLPAGGITNGVLVDQLGGGISQYTTTLFNAAFYAGLDFGEYQAHSIYFSRYPYGREATLSHPHPDLEIINTSPYGVLIWPQYTDTSITVTLYSTKHVDVEETGQTTSMQGVCTRVRTERTRRFHDGRVEVDHVGALYRRQEGENCSGESSVPTTEPPPPPPTDPPPPPPTDPPPPPSTDPPPPDPPAEG